MGKATQDCDHLTQKLYGGLPIIQECHKPAGG